MQTEKRQCSLKTPQAPKQSAETADSPTDLLAAGNQPTSSFRFHRNVWLLSMTSFFTDVSAEMVYPLVQGFVTAILASQRALIGPVLGIIEGVAESTASFIKLYAGYYSDKIRMRKIPTIVGYSLSALAKTLFFLASWGWYFILLARIFDRAGKGIRGAPRDAMISESTPASRIGSAFGLQHAMDFAGATVGNVICFFLVSWLLDSTTGTLRDLRSFYYVFALSILPAFAAVVCLFFTKETTGRSAVLDQQERPKPNLNFRVYPRSLQLFFLATVIFTLGNSSNHFLLLRCRNLGIPLTSIILMYLLFNLSTTIFAMPFGALSDRIGRKRILALGWTLYALVYAGFGFVGETYAGWLWLFWPLYGLYYALTQGVEKAFLSKLAPPGSKATVFGIHQTIVGIGLLPASAVAGILFAVHPATPFVLGAALALSAAGLLLLGVKEVKRPERSTTVAP